MSFPLADGPDRRCVGNALRPVAEETEMTGMMMMSLLLSANASGPDGAEILNDLRRVSVLGTVLYVTAHPDDENTRLLATLAKESKVRAAYLSFTRGEGGQNLIGAELGTSFRRVFQI